MTSRAKEEAEYYKLKPVGDYSWTEPPSDWDARSPLNKVTASESGHFMEMDDTPGAERVRIQHRTGTFTEIQSTGLQIVKVVGDKYEIIAANNNVLISGVCNITINGDSVINVKGDAYSLIEGDSFQTVNGKLNVNSGDDMNFFSSGDINLTAENISITAAEAVNITSDVNTSGTITSKQSITAVENVTAGFKLFSNLGVETLGPITSLVSVWSPLTQGLVVSDVKGSMDLIRLLYNMHVHPRTGTPIPLM